MVYLSDSYSPADLSELELLNLTSAVFVVLVPLSRKYRTNNMACCAVIYINRPHSLWIINWKHDPWLLHRFHLCFCFSRRFRFWRPAGSCFFWPALVESVLIVTESYRSETNKGQSPVDVFNCSVIGMETSLGLLIVWTLSSLLIISVSVIFVCVVSSMFVFLR